MAVTDLTWNPPLGPCEAGSVAVTDLHRSPPISGRHRSPVTDLRPRLSEARDSRSQRLVERSFCEMPGVAFRLKIATHVPAPHAGMLYYYYEFAEAAPF